MHKDVDRPSSAVRVHRTLGCLAIAHAAVALSATFVALRFGLPEWFDRVWVAFVMTWLFWPFVLIFHHGRSGLRIVVALLVSFFLLTLCAPWFAKISPRVFSGTDRMPTLDRPNVVGSQSLGAGFRRVQLEEFITGGFESIYHGEYLYFRDRKLGEFGSSSVAPSRQLAVFAEDDLNSPLRDDHFGFHVFLFRASDQKVIQLTQELQYDWKGFEWDESAGYLILRHHHAPPERFSLPKA